MKSTGQQGTNVGNVKRCRYDARFVYYVYKLLRLLQLIVKVGTTLIHLLRVAGIVPHADAISRSILTPFSLFRFLFFFSLSLSIRTTQELSVELEGRREEQSTLATSGQRLVNTLDNSQNHQQSNNDDALMLRRRLDDMNRRWSGLRAKTVAIR